MHEFFPENLRNPAHNRRAGLMRQFSSGQLYSIILEGAGAGAFLCIRRLAGGAGAAALA
jgi:hypothetical protein